MTDKALTKLEPQDVADNAAFDFWWYNEGSGMPPLPEEDTEIHVQRISRIAWLNGAFTARGSSDGK